MIKIYKKYSFYVSDIESLTENRLKEISNKYDPETQRIERLKQIKKWPITSTSKVFEMKKMFNTNTMSHLKIKIEELKTKNPEEEKYKKSLAYQEHNFNKIGKKINNYS